MEYQIQKPLRESKSILAKVRGGSPRTRDSHESIIRKSIKELYFLRKPFNSITEINMDHIEYLIDHWKNLKLSNGTIGNRLSVLRKYFTLANHNVKIPSNYELGFVRKLEPANTQNISSKIINQVHHNVTKLILRLQIYFGLTKSEAVRFRVQLYNNYENLIFIPKDIAHNNKDRIIIMHSDNQEKVIEDLLDELGDKLSLVEKVGHRTPVDLYNAELKYIDHSTKTPFRSLYARQEYEHLSNAENLPHKESIKRICGQMGISEVKVVKSWVNNE